MDTWLDTPPSGTFYYNDNDYPEIGLAPNAVLSSVAIVNALMLSAVLWAIIGYVAFSI